MVFSATFSLQPISDENILLSISNNDLALTDSFFLNRRQIPLFNKYDPSFLRFSRRQAARLFSGILFFCARTRQAGYPVSSAH